MQKALFPKQVYFLAFSCVRKSLKKNHSSEQHQVQMYIASAQIYGFQTAIDMKTRQKRRKNAQEDNIRISVKKVVQWGGMGLVVDERFGQLSKWYRFNNRCQSVRFSRLWHQYLFINWGRDMNVGVYSLYRVFFYCSALKMTKYKEKSKYPNCSANCSSRKVLSVNPQ